MTAASNGRIGSLGKAIDILRLLAGADRGLPLVEVARQLQLHPSTTHHLLATLRDRGFVGQDPRTRAYRLGYGLIELVGAHLGTVDLYTASIDAIRELRDRSGETAYLTVLENEETMALIELPGSKPIQVKRLPRPGQTCLHSTASGKVLLAYLPPQRAEALLSSSRLHRFTRNTIVSLPRLRAEFAAIREQGYALDREEDYIGVGCVAAPIFGRYGECVASASVSFPAAQLAEIDAVIALVREAARTISANLGHVPAKGSNGARWENAVRRGG